jgi:signal transduction histidine kinase
MSPWQHVEITTALDPARPRAWADERQVRRVLRNLVKNACEAQPSGGKVRISTRGGEAGGMVAITVADEGPGIPRDVQDRMFDTGFTTKTSGSGVGLSVSRRVIEQHGGTIEVDSAPGKGTRITLRLPEGNA